MKAITPYLTFDGNCRDAMTFYETCLGGTLEMTPFSAGPGSAPPKADEDKIMHAKLANGSACLMASDAMPGVPVTRGNNFSVSVNCETLEEIERLFKALGEKGKAAVPLHDAFWGSRFGMLTDQFGVRWMLSMDAPAPR